MGLIMHFTKRLWATAAALASATLLPATASAAVVTVHFSGVVASAESGTIDHFAVGQKFSGDVSWDTSLPSDADLSPLTGFNIVIGGVDYSDRFIPRFLAADGDGSLRFVTGGSSQGGSAELDLNLGSFMGNYPPASALKGKSGTFSYTDFVITGGSVAGRAFIAGVPEPATWALMMVGFGAVAGARRRRKHSAAATV
jgi:hypothetical protein